MEVEVGAVYRMKRKHPCGTFEFAVFRAGADIGIECTGCGRKVMLERERFESRVRSTVEVAK